MSDLAIPEASYRAMLDAQDDWDDDDILVNSIRDVANPIVAAELRRLASSPIGLDSSSRTLLRARAAELDGSPQ